MSLPSGNYYILNGDEYVGRRFVEDGTQNPKEVVCPAENNTPQTWRIEALANGRYKLAISGSPIAPLGGRLFSILLPNPSAEEWFITQRTSVGSEAKAVYTIEVKDKNSGWVSIGEVGDKTQIKVRPLHIQSGNTFASNSLWEIVSAEEV